MWCCCAVVRAKMVLWVPNRYLSRSGSSGGCYCIMRVSGGGGGGGGSGSASDGEWVMTMMMCVDR